MNTPMRVILVAQGVGLAYALYKRQHVAGVVTAMTIGGLLLGEYESMNAAPAKAIAGGPPGTISSISSLGDLRRLVP